MTIIEGELVEFNCTPTEITGQLATWVINGERHYWTDFMAKPEFKFNLNNNSLMIRNASRSLDGSTFQCIINRRASSIAYLTVLNSTLFTENSITTPATTSSESTLGMYRLHTEVQVSMQFTLPRVAGPRWCKKHRDQTEVTN